MCVTFIDILDNDYEMTYCYDISSPSATVYLQLCFTVTISRSYAVVVKSLLESTIIPLLYFLIVMMQVKHAQLLKTPM